MAESLFGLVPPVWSAVPAFGYFQTPMLPGSRPIISAVSPGIPAAPGPVAFTSGMGSGMPATSTLPADAYGLGVMPVQGGPSVGPGLSAVVSPPMGPTFPIFAGPEIAVGVTAPALLATVAVRRGQPLGPTNDQEIEDFICDALDLLPGASEVEVRCEGGLATLTGTVPHKRLKRDVGEVTWAIPSLTDVQNNVVIAARRRSRAPRREPESPSPTVAARKQA